MNYPGPDKLTDAIAAQSGIKYFYLPENKQEIEPKLGNKMTPEVLTAITAGIGIIAGAYAIYLAQKRNPNIFK